MERYRFDAHTQAAFESSVVPLAIYQLVDGHVVTLVASDGLCELFGYGNRAEAVEKMDGDMYWNVHPDDVQRVQAVAEAFIREDKPYNLVCRVKRENGYRLIHTRGRHIVTETGARLAVVWYIDEGAVVLDARMEQDEERIEELKASMHSLLNNMPAMSFSKDMKTGAYLACNQAFAAYANKRTPADVVGLTDYDIFDPETAAHFVEDDRKALSMDKPYVFLEDAHDAVGNPHQLQTTKLNFVDETGRLCLLGMSMDVTGEMEVRRESERAKAACREALNASAIYESIVKALSEDYFNLYYVDVETDDYIEYGSRTEEGHRETAKIGVDFFAESRKNAPKYIYPEDVERFRTALDKEKLLEGIGRHGSCVYHYRLLIDGVPTFVSMKAARIAGDDRHIIIGVSNVDTQMKDHIAAERAVEERKTYLRLSALYENLIVLYFVDPEDERYTEFSASKGFEGLGLAKQGTDFFRTTCENSMRLIHPEDQELFQKKVTKENILATIERDGVFLFDYRLLSGELPTYVRLKAAKVEEEGRPLLVIGFLDEDAQIRQEQAYARDLSVARKMAVVDFLTGVKNKHAYVEWEEKINAKIDEGTQEPFAVVVCDINHLKEVNDLYGHREGDACIKKACARICRVFSHSPVFRIGGDEFVVLLTGDDYDRRKELLDRINAVPANASQIKIGETISAGMVEYSAERYHSLLAMFEDADRAMYARKQYINRTYFAK